MIPFGPRCVLDASAMLAYLLDEPGAVVVEQAIADGACISIVNLAETLTKLAELGQDPDAAADQLAAEGVLHGALEVLPLDEAQARDVARLRPLTRSIGLSLGDRACLALARGLSLPALTTDRAWQSVALGITVKAIR